MPLTKAFMNLIWNKPYLENKLHLLVWEWEKLYMKKRANVLTLLGMLKPVSNEKSNCK